MWLWVPISMQDWIFCDQLGMRSDPWHHTVTYIRFGKNLNNWRLKNYLMPFSFWLVQYTSKRPPLKETFKTSKTFQMTCEKRLQRALLPGHQLGSSSFGTSTLISPLSASRPRFRKATYFFAAPRKSFVWCELLLGNSLEPSPASWPVVCFKRRVALVCILKLPWETAITPPST